MALPQARHVAEHVGILAIQCAFPASFVAQQDLEQHDGVEGKYTAGLGQEELGFCGDREDAISLALTALSKLMARYGVRPEDVGRLEVGSESGGDASKSVKSHLMTLFAASGFTDIEGCDCLHACYAATSAVQSAAAWLESRAWDGRLAVVVATDVATYAPGPARSSSGAGAAAILLGPDAPLALERGLSASAWTPAYDFCRPTGAGPFPIVDGRQSVELYLATLRACYERYNAKFEAAWGRPFSLEEAEAAVFHAPFHRLATKAAARLLYLDLCRFPGKAGKALGPDLDPALLPPSAAALPPLAPPPALERALGAAVLRPPLAGKVLPATGVQRRCGNMYNASLWAGLAQLVEARGVGLEGGRVLLFSYGSGAAGLLLSLVGRAVEGRFALARLQEQGDVAASLAARVRRTPVDFEAAMALAAQRWGAAGYVPSQPLLEDLPPGAYHLLGVDPQHRRTYGVKV